MTHLNPRDYSNDDIRDAILHVLREYTGSRYIEGDPWMSNSTLTSCVAERVEDPARTTWPGDAFHHKVQREANKLAEAGTIAKIGAKESRPLANGHLRAPYGLTPHFQTRERAAEVQAQFDKARSALAAHNAAVAERIDKLNGWLAESGIEAHAPIMSGSRDDLAVIPVDVLEELLARLAPEKV